uniref:Uncharacterized protein n=1 Tax=Arundo donax TaxID=35708 RepID=A0A0A9G4X4_ARUDO
MPAPRSSASNSPATPEASSMEAATLKARASARTRVMLTAAGGRDSEAARSNPEGTTRPSTASTLRLYGTAVMAPTTEVFDPGDGAGEWTTTVEFAPEVRLTAPRSEGARPVVCNSVVTSFPEAGMRARSDGERYSSRTWYRSTSAMSAPAAAANAEGDCGRLAFGTASSVSEDLPASSPATGVDASNRAKSAKLGNAASTAVTFPPAAGSGSAAAASSTSAAQSARRGETGGTHLPISPVERSTGVGSEVERCDDDRGLRKGREGRGVA